MHPELVVPGLVERYPGLFMGQSTRVAGNLGLHTDDDRSAVLSNRARLWELIGTSEDQSAGGYQVHGDAVKLVTEPGYFDGHDAFVTNVPGVFLSVTIADCVPVLIYDPVRTVLGAVHAGWRGTAAGITAKTVARMRDEFGTDPADCVAYIGTCISYDSFEVGDDVAAHFSEEFKTQLSGRYHVDLKGVNRSQLLKAGLRGTAIEISPFCTVKDSDRFFSHRKEQGKTGRMLAIIGVRTTA